MKTATFILRKTLLYAILIIAIITFNFVLIHAAPGDPVTIIAGRSGAKEEYLNRLRESYGLDKPLYEQYFLYLSKILQGDFGYSILRQAPVLDLLMPRFFNTVILVISSILLATVLGISLGVLAATKVYSKTDNFLSVLSTAGYSMPHFWLAEIVILIFALYLGWLPSGGMISLGENPYGIFDRLVHLFLPMLVLAAPFIGQLFRLTRSGMLEVLAEDYIKTARSKGLPERRVLFKHALRNALLSIITFLGILFRTIIEGAVLVEVVFGWPGLGKLIFDSTLDFDYPLIMGAFIFMAIVVIFSQFAVDTIYSIVDPRISLE